MLIAALVLAVIGLAALVMAVVTSNELIAWVCIAASAIGVILLIVDALRERSHRDSDGESDDESDAAATDSGDPESVGSDYEDYPDEAPIAEDYDDNYDGSFDESPAGSPAEDPAAVDVESEPRTDGQTPKN